MMIKNKKKVLVDGAERREIRHDEKLGKASAALELFFSETSHLVVPWVFALAHNPGKPPGHSVVNLEGL